MPPPVPPAPEAPPPPGSAPGPPPLPMVPKDPKLNPVTNFRKSKKTIKLFWRELHQRPDKAATVWDDLQPVTVDYKVNVELCELVKLYEPIEKKKQASLFFTHICMMSKIIAIDFSLYVGVKRYFSLVS